MTEKSGGAAELVTVSDAAPFYVSTDKNEVKVCIDAYNAVTGEDAKPYTKIDFKGRAGLVVGAEGAGISRLVRENCDFIAELPMPGGFESLNAGVAAAVTMYEIIRQRG